MKEIPLTQRKIALVDDIDFAVLNRFKWRASRNRPTANWYAIRTTPRKTPKRLTICMHREILNLKTGQLADHINGNGLDNRRSNLRVVNAFQNASNSRFYLNNTSGARGVVWVSKRRKWMAQIRANNRNIFLGHFASKQDAIVTRKQAEEKHFGEYRRKEHTT